jgi:integrase/recombinase XerD
VARRSVQAITPKSLAFERRNYAKTTVPYYIQAVERFAKHFQRRPDQLNQTHLREYQAYLLRDRKLEPRTVKLHVSALRFFFVKTLKRPYVLDDIPYPKVPRRLPTILTVDEVTRPIDAARPLTDRTMPMVLYSTGMRNAEMRSLHVKDIDSRSMLIHIQRGKGGARLNCPSERQPITPKVVWEACRIAATRAQLEKRVSPHLLRHSYASHLGGPRSRRWRCNNRLRHQPEDADGRERQRGHCEPHRLSLNLQNSRSPPTPHPSPRRNL